MIALRMFNTYEASRHEICTRALPESVRPLRRVLMQMLSRIGLGVGGVAALDSSDYTDSD